MRDVTVELKALRLHGCLSALTSYLRVAFSSSRHLWSCSTRALPKGNSGYLQNAVGSAR